MNELYRSWARFWCRVSLANCVWLMTVFELEER